MGKKILSRTFILLAIQGEPTRHHDPVEPCVKTFWIRRPAGSYLKVTVPPEPGNVTLLEKPKRRARVDKL